MGITKVSVVNYYENNWPIGTFFYFSRVLAYLFIGRLLADIYS